MTYTRRQFKADLREPYAWPGGYEKVWVTSDGELLCNECCRKEAREILTAMRDPRDSSGWRITACDLLENHEEDEWCAHCNKQLVERSDPDDYHDDITSTDGVNWYQNGKLVLTTPDGTDRNALLRDYMERTQLWPDVWTISDHGNSNRITTEVLHEPSDPFIIEEVTASDQQSA